MALKDKTVRVVILGFVFFFVFIALNYYVVVKPSKSNYEKTFQAFEAQFPMQVIEKSFQSYTSPPWKMSENQMTSKEKFLNMLEHDDLFAIYREKDSWSGDYVYYVAISPTEHSTFIALFKYEPEIVEVDNGFLSPKTYEIN